MTTPPTTPADPDALRIGLLAEELREAILAYRDVLGDDDRGKSD
jgi:hypothetical protein